MEKCDVNVRCLAVFWTPTPIITKRLLLFSVKLLFTRFVVQLLSHVWFFATPWTVARQSCLSFTICWILLKLLSPESVMSSHHLILCCPVLLLHSIFPCIRVFSNALVLCMRWPKYWSLSLSISPIQWISPEGLISFKIDSFELLADQGPLKSLLQHQGSKASIIRYSVSL